MPNFQTALRSNRYLWAIFLLVGFCLLAMPQWSFAAGEVYYVATNGNDSSAGSSQQPWKTIQYAVNNVQAGDTIIVNPGVYREKVVFNRSGNSTDGPITIKYDGTTRPIVDGGNFPASQPHDVFLIANQSYLVIEGFELRNFHSTGTSITTVAIRITGTSNNIELINNEIHHFEADANTGADALGIAVYGNSETAPIHNVTIRNNEVHDMKLGFSESVVVSGNVDGFLIADNHIHHNDNIGIDIVGFEDWVFGDNVVAVNQARNGIVVNNLVHHIDAIDNPAYTDGPSAGGIYVDGGADVVIERNKVYENNFGISVGSENPGHDSSGVTVRNNLVYFNHIAGIITGGYNLDVGGASNNQFVHNTLYHNGTLEDGSGEFWIQNSVDETLVQNNIFYADTENVFITNWATLPTATTIDNNIYYSSPGANSSQWAWGNAYQYGFVSWRSASGNDANSRFVNPDFVSPSNADYNLLSSSPAIDQAVTTGYDGSVDFAGASRVSGSQSDIGAYEVSQNNSPPRGHLGTQVAQDCVLHGWAFDPDTPNDQINLLIEIDDSFSITIPTDKLRQDVNDAFNITGLHGIRWQIPSQFHDDTVHTVVATAINTPAGQNVQLVNSGMSFSCSSDRPPRGHLDKPVNRYCELAGWAFDIDVPSESINVELTIDNNFSVTLPTNLFRRGVNDLFGTSGNHGFRWRIPEQFHDDVDHTITGKALNSQDGTGVTMANSGMIFRCAADLPPRGAVSKNISQHCEAIAWAFDYDETEASIDVRFVIDGNNSFTVPTDRTRQDVNNAFGITGKHGVRWQIPEQFQDDGLHVLRTYAINLPDGEAVEIRNSGFEFSCSSNALPRGYIARQMPSSCILHGWSFDPDFPDQSIDVRIEIDGANVETITTDLLRQDVNNYYSITGLHGFRWNVPGQFRDGQPHVIRAIAINQPSGPNFALFHSGQTFTCDSE